MVYIGIPVPQDAGTPQLLDLLSVRRERPSSSATQNRDKPASAHRLLLHRAADRTMNESCMGITARIGLRCQAPKILSYPQAVGRLPHLWMGRSETSSLTLG